MVAGERKESADQQHVAAAVVHGDTVAGDRIHDGRRILRLERQIGGQHDAAPAVQQEAIALLEADRLLNAFDHAPASALQYRGELDPLVFRKRERPLARRVEPCIELTARLQQRKHIRKRIHRQSIRER